LPEAPSITKNCLPYALKLDSRSLESINLVVIHCTELPDLATARDFGQHVHYEESGTGNSGHYYIERNGDIEQWIPLERIAHHVRNHNEYSVGIELVNRGRYPDWFDSRKQIMTEPFPAEQVSSLLCLLNHLQNRLPSLTGITSHSALDNSQLEASDQPNELVYRKLDPGPMFPWDKILSNVTLEWHEPSDFLPESP
jgi:N-acetylmuramoyl-L-alanine amidase